MTSKKHHGVVFGDTVPFPTLSCICCGKKLESVMGENADNQPYAGTTFFTHGHYGSTVFDPMNGSFLEINVCDDCLKERASLKRVAFKHIDRPHALPYKYWEPEKDE